MKKYLLVGLCLLAFVAGGAAQLALHRSGANAAPPTTEKIAGAIAPAENKPDAEAPSHTQQTALADAETPAEQAEVLDGQDEPAAEVSEAGDESRSVVRATRKAPAASGRAGLRAAPAARPSSAAPPPATRTAAPGPATRTASGAPAARAASRDEGVREKAASGARKTGRWVKKGLKKIGGIFQD